MLETRFFQSPENIQTNFFLAIQDGNFEEVNKKILMNIIDINCFVEGYTPLHIAARYGQANICKLLLEHGADINAVDHKEDMGFLMLASVGEKMQEKVAGETPLALAVTYGHLDVIKLLLSKGANVNIKEINGAGLLYRAIVTGNNKHNKMEMIVLLLKYNSDMQISGDMDNGTALHLAVRRHAFEIVKKLIEYHADINALDKYKNTPLHIAVKNKDLEMTRYLLDKGADGNIKNKGEQTPLELTECRSYDELLRYGFDHHHWCQLT